MEKDESGRFIDAFISIGENGDVDKDVFSEYVCQMYGQVKTRDVNEARYKKFIEMTGKVDQVKKNVTMHAGAKWISN